MLFAIDFDGTYAAHPECFNALIDCLRSHGNDAVLVTQRGPEHAYEIESVTDNSLPIVYASGMTKKDAATRAGYDIDVWVDDEPIGVHTARTYMGPVLREESV